MEPFTSVIEKETVIVEVTPVVEEDPTTLPRDETMYFNGQQWGPVVGWNPYSNDMNHPDNKGKPQGGPDGMDILWKDPESTLTKWKTPLFEDEEIVAAHLDVVVDAADSGMVELRDDLDLAPEIEV